MRCLFDFDYRQENLLESTCGRQICVVVYTIRLLCHTKTRLQPYIICVLSHH